MAKRKKAQSRKRTTRKTATRKTAISKSTTRKATTRKGTTRKATSKRTGKAVAPPPSAHGPVALTPAAALPVRRERDTRGGRPTFSTHEFLAQVTPQAQPQDQARPEPRKETPTRAPDTTDGEILSQTQIYETLAALLVPYARRMESEMHPKIGYCLKAKSARTGRETHFGAVQVLPEGVAFHLFPLYGHPDLLEGVSPELFTCMRGKTCFHFEKLNAGQLAELAQLTHGGFERFLADGVF